MLIMAPFYLPSCTTFCALLHKFHFTENTQPVAGMRVAVDSKLRKKIREKKIAMGHKPDDHEDEQRMS